jgi:hypothetical protein
MKQLNKKIATLNGLGVVVENAPEKDGDYCFHADCYLEVEANPARQSAYFLIYCLQYCYFAT